MNKLQAVSEKIRAFTVCAFASESYYNTPEPITASDAAYNLAEMAADGVEIPGGLTPEIYAEFWNNLCKTSRESFGR